MTSSVCVGRQSAEPAGVLSRSKIKAFEVQLHRPTHQTNNKVPKITCYQGLSTQLGAVWGRQPSVEIGTVSRSEIVRKIMRIALLTIFLFNIHFCCLLPNLITDLHLRICNHPLVQEISFFKGIHALRKKNSYIFLQ